MKDIVVHTSPYMDEESRMFKIRVKSIEAYILNMAFDYEDFWDADPKAFEEYHGFDPTDSEQLMTAFSDNNGDGQPYITILDLETGIVYD